MKEMERAIIMGEPSAGGLDEPMLLTLPGDILIMFCSKKYINPDGTQPNKTGILPDIEVTRDYESYKKGKDNVIERAIQELRKQI